MTRARIILADDHPLILEGLRALLERHHEVVERVTDGAALIEKALKYSPEVIVLDVTMPKIGGIDAARQIRAALPKTRFVFISMHVSPIYIHKAFEAGGSAYVLKSGASEELLTAIDAAMSGKRYLSSALGCEVAEQITRAPFASDHLKGLTTRQLQILQHLAEGKQNKEIAGLLSLSVRTIEFHRGRLMARLGARTAAELTLFAIEQHLIDAGRQGSEGG